MVLFYCEKCGTRVDPEDLQAGTARLIDDNRAVCLACCSQERSASGAVTGKMSGEIEVSETEVFRADTPVRPDSKTQRLINKNASASTQKAHAIGSSAVRRATGQTAPRTPSAKMPAVEAEPPGPNKWMAFGLGAGVVLLGVTIALLRPFGGSDEKEKNNETAAVPATPKTNPDPIVKPPEPPPVADIDKITPPPADLGPHAKQAHIMLEEAKLFARKNPDNTDGYIERLDQVYNAYRFTPAGQEAQSLLQKTYYPDPATQLAPESQWSSAVNLSPLVDPAKDIVSGKWKHEGSKWIVEPERTARLQLPFEPPEEYDFRIVFTRVGGEEDVNMMLPAKGKMLMWSMSPSKNSCMGFETINGKDAQTNPDSIRVKPALENNRIYTCVVQVRKRVVRAYLDGKIVKEHRTNYNEFGMRNDWKMKNDRVLGLGGHNSKIIFDRIELRNVTGTGRPLR